MINNFSSILLFFIVLQSIGCNANDAPKNSNSIKAIEEKEDSTKISTVDSIVTNEKIVATCQQIECALWAKVNLSEQKMELYENGVLTNTFKVSTGDKRHKTPAMNRRFGGRMYLKYTSKKFPGGDFMGLGNMPYVVFVKGGYAIHGTTPGNFNRLGKVASHGCIRLHPDNAKIFFELIKKVGNDNTWITVANE
jgi:lipoprotein-anchoring transpeptidase ErfK/SrfK